MLFSFTITEFTVTKAALPSFQVSWKESVASSETNMPSRGADCSNGLGCNFYCRDSKSWIPLFSYVLRIEQMLN